MKATSLEQYQESPNLDSSGQGAAHTLKENSPNTPEGENMGAAQTAKISDIRSCLDRNDELLKKLLDKMDTVVKVLEEIEGNTHPSYGIGPR